VNETKSARYHRLKRRAALLSLVVTAALLVWLLLSGASATLRDASGSTAGYVLLLACIHEAVTLPIAFYRTFLLERKYGLSSEPTAAWLKDHAKAFVLLSFLGLGAAHVVYATMRLWPDAWWLASALALMAAVLLITRVTPTVLLPLFYRFTPLARETLRARLVDLSQRAGVRIVDVFEWGLGEKTRRANAALVGTGATRRILLSDTLLAEYSDDEIEVILAHELAHHVHRDIAKALVLELVLLLAGLRVAAYAIERAWTRLGLSGPSDVAGLPVLLLTAGAVMLAATPLANAVSRMNEYRADRFAVKLTGRPDAFISAMRRLGNQNLAEERPSRMALWLFHTHPPVEDRIREARGS
jgi:STE24 endopeptidase